MTGRLPTHQRGLCTRLGTKWNKYQEKSKARDDVRAIRSICWLIIALNGILITPVPARGSEISRAGMALHAPVALYPGDVMQLQFPTSTPARVKAVVRNRTGECLGLEFLTQLPPDNNEARDRSRFLRSSLLSGSPELRKCAPDSCNPQTLYAGLRRKQEELRQVQREIEALKMAIPLLSDDIVLVGLK